MTTATAIDLTPEQLRAVQAIETWWRSPTRSPIFTVAGYAGTGKSTVVRHVIDQLRIPDSRVAFLAYTGKAALVLRRKGLNARTIHSLIYAPQDDGSGHVRFELRDALEDTYSLFVVDEVSMVSAELLSDLLTFGVPILALGDPAQLPPVEGDGCGILYRPDAFLREIHRQAADNPILWASMLAREGSAIPAGDYGDALRIVRPRDVYSGDVDLEAFDQVLCVTNKTRRWLNGIFRDRRGFTDPLPVSGDRLISLRNVKDTVSTSTYTPMVNGLQCVATTAPWSVSVEGERGFLTAHLEGDASSAYENLEVDLWPFTQRGPKPPGKNARLPQFDYGYAITVHKSQGSEWDRVLLLASDMDRGPWTDTEKRQLAYTGITRAAKHLTLAVGRA